MDVEASAKPTMVIDYDVDAGPVVFKWRISKQNQLNLKVKKPISQMQDGHSRRQISRGHHLNGVNSGSHKGKLLQSSKASLAKSPLASPKASSIKVSSVKPSSSVKPPSSVKSPVINLKTSTSSGGYHSEDFEDEKPLSDRLKGNSNHSSKGLGKSSTGSTLPLVSKNIVKPSPDSNDEPLSTRFPAKSNAATSISKNYDYDDKKPLSSINQLNGSTKKPLAVPTKKPLDKENSSSQSSVKKPKLSDSPALMKNKQVSTKVEPKVDDDDHIPISQRIKKSTVSNSKSSSTKQTLKKVVSSSFKKTNKKMKKTAQNSKYSKSTKVLPISGDGQKKWTTLVHNGVIFPPAYKPHGVKMLYNGKPVDLTPEQEEVGCNYVYSYEDTEYMQKQTFRQNFWTDWRKLLGKNHVIQNLDTCDFTPIYDWYQNEKEQKKQMSTYEKKALKEDKSKQEEKYMWVVVDDVKEKVSNFRVEPLGLFRGHEEHPKICSICFYRRIHPSDVTINIGKDIFCMNSIFISIIKKNDLILCLFSDRWREIRHDNIVTWLAFWNDPINPREFKYVFMAASSSLRGKAYERDFTSSDVLTFLAILENFINVSNWLQYRNDVSIISLQIYLRLLLAGKSFTVHNSAARILKTLLTTRVFVAQPIERVSRIVPRFHESRLGLQREVLEVVQKENKVILEDTLHLHVVSPSEENSEGPAKTRLNYCNLNKYPQITINTHKSKQILTYHKKSQKINKSTQNYLHIKTYRTNIINNKYNLESLTNHIWPVELVKIGEDWEKKNFLQAKMVRSACRGD
ncbi:hypothetical protein UlMin_018297 [Ulmus minor]